MIKIDCEGLSPEIIEKCLADSIKDKKLKKVLLIPPDITRANSGAGMITSIYYKLLDGAHVDILPATGTHTPMTREEQISFFGEDIPAERYLIHDWRGGVTKIGEVPADFICDISDGVMNEPFDVEISDYILDLSYDLILSIGQVVPHEVAGMANYTKNIAIGCGGSNFISSSHILGAFYGMERIMGRDNTPVRKVFDYVQENFLSRLPVIYIMTVIDKNKIIGLFIDKGRGGFTQAATLSRKYNINYVKPAFKTCVVWLDEREFKSAWLGNKAIYRTRMAMADGGRLIILAPGVKMFGEDNKTDELIRRYGYTGRKNIIRLCKTEPDLKDNLSAAAHLIHGSSDGRFKIIYAAKYLTEEEVEGVGFEYMLFDEAVKKYNPETLREGYNLLSDEEIYFISNPALGLWSL